MTVPAGWACYGNANGAHRLLRFDGLDETLFKEIRWYTDLPAQAGTDWESSFAGYRALGRYVVQYTTPDSEALRPGMVLTRLAVFDVACVRHTPMSALRAGIPELLAVDATRRQSAREDAPAAIGPALDLLASGSPVYWLGAEGYMAAVDAIWQILNPDDRESFVFGQIFSPSGVPYPVDSSSLQMYLVPKSAGARFEAGVIDPDHPTELSATAAAILSGRSELPAALGLSDPSIRTWPRLAALDAYLSHVDSLDHEQTRSCLHILLSLAPPTVGVEQKALVCRHLLKISPSVGFAAIWSCRNIDFDALPSGTLDSLLASWCSATVVERRAPDVAAAIEAITSDEDPGHAFRARFAEAMALTCSSAESGLAHNLADAARSGDRPALVWLTKHATHKAEVDRLLADQLEPPTPDWVAAVAIGGRLIETHAAVCDLKDSTEAWRQHLSNSSHSDRSRERLAARCSSHEIVAAALAIGHVCLIERAGRLLAAGLAQLREPQAFDDNWLRILAAAADEGLDPWSVLPAAQARNAILDAVLAEVEPIGSLVTALADEPTVDLLSYPQRAQVWSRLVGADRASLLSRTALAVTLAGSSSGLETTLGAEVCSERNLRAAAAVDVTRAIDTLEELASECDARAAIGIVEAAELAGDAQRFGRVVAAQRWTAAARHLARRAQQRPDMAAATAACQHILPVLDRVMLALGSGERPTPKDLSEGLLEIAARLYPGGPLSASLWQRAGGEPADLDSSGTGRAQWARAIVSIFQGSAGAPQLVRLVREMSADFPNNSQLGKLLEIYG